jgi:hypothetical protein
LRRARPLLLLVLVSSGLLLIGAAVIGAQAALAKRDLVNARHDLSRAQDAVRRGDQLAAKSSLSLAESRAHRAAARPTGWLWSAYEHLPIAADVVRETRGILRVTDAVTADVLAPLVDLAPASSSWSGRADLAALSRASAPLASADARLGVERQRLAGLPNAHLEPLGKARHELANALESLAVDVRDASVAAKTLPALLGSGHPTTLLVVAQNLAEERATGGLVGSFALVSARDGKLSLLRSGSDSELVDAAGPVVDLGADFEARYGRAEATSTWRSANVTPDVPSAGAILAGLSMRQLGVRVDAVVLVDPVALANVLDATGPVAVPGLGSVSADNAVELLMKGVYDRYPSTADQPQRKEALRRSLDAVIERLEGPVSGKLGPQVVRAVATGHLRVFATDASLQTVLVRSRVGGALPAVGPFLSVVTQDVGGSKLDYYLQREIDYRSALSPEAVSLGVGSETVEEGILTVRLTNNAPPAGLPPYVTARADLPGKHPTGQLRTWLSVYLGPRSSYSAAKLDGRAVAMASQVEKGLSVFSTFVSIDPGATVTLAFRFQQPAAPDGTLLWMQQPRLRSDVLVVRRSAAVPVARMYSAR